MNTFADNLYQLGQPGQLEDESAPEPLGGRSLAEQAAAAGLVCYLVGFYIVNCYLFRFGLTDLSPLNPQFIYIGSFSIIPIVIVFALVKCWESKDSWRKEDADWKMRFVPTVCWHTLLAIYLYLIWSYTLKFEAQDLKTWGVGVTYLYVDSIALATALAFLLDRKRAVNKDIAVKSMLALIAWYAFVNYSQAFADHYLRYEAPQFAGVRPVLARIVFDDKVTDNLADAELPILWRTDKEYSLCVNGKVKIVPIAAISYVELSRAGESGRSQVDSKTRVLLFRPKPDVQGCWTATSHWPWPFE